MTEFAVSGYCECLASILELWPGGNTELSPLVVMISVCSSELCQREADILV